MPRVAPMALMLPCLAALAADSSPARAPCDAFRQLLSAPPGQGLERLAPKTRQHKGTLLLQGLDLDKDGKPDALALGCPTALQSRGECILDVQLSSGGAYAVQDQHLSVVSHQGVVYAVVGASGPARTAGSGKLLRLDRAVHSVCTGL